MTANLLDSPVIKSIPIILKSKKTHNSQNQHAILLQFPAIPSNIPDYGKEDPRLMDAPAIPVADPRPFSLTALRYRPINHQVSMLMHQHTQEYANNSNNNQATDEIVPFQLISTHVAIGSGSNNSSNSDDPFTDQQQSNASISSTENASPSCHVACISRGKLYLIPLEAAYQMRVQVNQNTGVDATALNDSNQKGTDKGDAFSAGRMLQVQIRRRETDDELAARQRSYAYYRGIFEAEAWQNYKLFDTKSTLSQMAMEQLFDSMSIKDSSYDYESHLAVKKDSSKQHDMTQLLSKMRTLMLKSRVTSWPDIVSLVGIPADFFIGSTAGAAGQSNQLAFLLQELEKIAYCIDPKNNNKVSDDKDSQYCPECANQSVGSMAKASNENGSVRWILRSDLAVAALVDSTARAKHLAICSSTGSSTSNSKDNSHAQLLQEAQGVLPAWTYTGARKSVPCLSLADALQWQRARNWLIWCFAHQERDVLPVGLVEACLEYFESMDPSLQQQQASSDSVGHHHHHHANTSSDKSRSTAIALIRSALDSIAELSKCKQYWQLRGACNRSRSNAVIGCLCKHSTVLGNASKVPAKGKKQSNGMLSHQMNAAALDDPFHVNFNAICRRQLELLVRQVFTSSSVPSTTQTNVKSR